MTERKNPMRKCVGCNEMKDKRELVRVVRTADGVISLDLTGKAAGRGAYVCKNGKCLESAIKSRRIDRALKCAVPAEVYGMLKESIVSDE